MALMQPMAGLGSQPNLLDPRIQQVMQMLQALRGSSGFGAGAASPAMPTAMQGYQPNVMPMQAAPVQSPMGQQGGGMGDMTSMLPMMLMMMRGKGLGAGNPFPGVPSGFRM